MSNTAYQEKQVPRSEYLAIRGLRYHLRHWGRKGAPILVLAHGWMDVSASFQFVVDHLTQDYHVIAPDWRGFGLTTGHSGDSYWFPDYLADLDAILRHYSPQEPVYLLGHSMGANVVSLYAGVRPERVRKLINLEGFGLPQTHPKQAPSRMRMWLDQIQEGQSLRPYASQADVAKRLQKTNPRLSEEKAMYLAQHWASQNEHGEWQILADPAHKLHGPSLFRVEEMLACWNKITAPTLWMEAVDTNVWEWMGAKEQAHPEIEARLSHIANLQKYLMQDAGHMLHHDQPELLARLIDEFLNPAE